MTRPNSSEAPLEGTTGAVNLRAADTFELLCNETRLAILFALWETYDPHATHNSMSFSNLRDRVGVRQGAQFNYHLDKLVDQFVRKSDDGYELKRSGLVLVQSIIAGMGIEEPTLEPTEIDTSCGFCGASTEITYENNYVYHVCTECQGDSNPGDEHPHGVLSGWTFEPTGLSGRTAEEVFAASTIKTFARIAMRFEGICPDCSAPVEWSLDVCRDHDTSSHEECPNCKRKRAIVAQETCTVCKSAGQGSPSIKLLFHPAVITFFFKHGIEVGFTGTTDFSGVIQTLDLLENFEEEVISVEPLRIGVSVSHDGDVLHLLLDEEMNVIEITSTG